MTAMKKAGFLNPKHFTFKTGEKEYLADLPDENLQIRYQVYADKPVQIWLGAGEIAIPLGTGTHFNRTHRVADCKFLLFRCEPDTNIAFNVGYTKIRLSEERDDTPVDISVPEPLSVDIAKMVSQLVGEQLAQNAGGTELDIEELIDDLPEGADPEFGAGFTIMEEHDPAIQRQLKEVDKELAQAQAQAKPPEPSAKPVAGNTDDGKGKPAS